MPYYPKSQIKTNLFTNGKKFTLSTTNEEYIGYYYEVSSGEAYTGKTPNNPPNTLLTPLPTPTTTPAVIGDVPFPLFPENNIYTIDISVSPTLPTRAIPVFNPTLPTDQDKVNGQFNRYFCKKNNEIKYLEIDKDTYQKLQNQDPKIAWDLYTPVIILWVIQGNQTQVFNSNKATVQAIEQNAKWYGFTQYFQDKFLKYYLGS